MTTDAAEPDQGFDFWVGQWEVHLRETDELIGHNEIRRVHDGHVLAESYGTVSGRFSGSSLNGFDHERGRWHQCWMDSTGLVLDLYGGVVDGDMVMTGQAVSGQTERISWTPLADGNVRQHWEQSTDDGATWITVFDGLYKSRPQPS
jgi:hypothetical protein